MILVLGGAGYIGSHAVKTLIERGKRVVVVDNLETGHREAVHPDAQLHEVDIRDLDALREIFELYTLEAVLHFSANSLVGESVEQPLKYFDNNVAGTLNVLKLMAEYGVKRIVFSSTAAVYGEPKGIPITEDAETLPTNPYGESKLMMERMFKWADRAYGIRYVSLRYFNVAGADPSGDIGEAHAVETHLIPLVLQVPLGQRSHISVFGEDYPTPDGTCVRDYIHVSDLIEAHLKALAYLGAENGTVAEESIICNLGNGTGFSVKEIIEKARMVTGHPIPSEGCARRAGDPSVLVASSEKAERILGWRPRYTSIEAIIEDAWRWHSKHPNGYKKTRKGV